MNNTGPTAGESRKANMGDICKYIILFQGRAGSTYLTEHMRHHGQIRAMFEEFTTIPGDWDSQLDWMSNFFYSNSHGDAIRAVGFKTKYTDIADLDLFTNFVQDNGIKVIHLFRRNLVKLIISVIRADELRRLHGDSNLYQAKKELGKIKVSPKEFRRHKKRIRHYKELRDFVDNLNVDICKVSYEQLLHNLDGSLKKIWRFLGVENQATQAEVMKNTPDRLEDAVENLDELKATFPEYERFFSESFDSATQSNV